MTKAETEEERKPLLEEEELGGSKGATFENEAECHKFA